MNALDCFLTAASDRPCEACRHAREFAHDGLYCHRAAGSPYPCQVERASAPVEAWLYGSCGRHGRFFEARAAAAPAWIAPDAQRRGMVDPDSTRQRVTQ
jgi:hypothetical protein